MLELVENIAKGILLLAGGVSILFVTAAVVYVLVKVSFLAFFNAKRQASNFGRETKEKQDGNS